MSRKAAKRPDIRGVLTNKQNMARITSGHLEMLVRKIGQKANIATSREEAVSKSQSHFLYLENASIYGGYRLVKVELNTEGHEGAFGSSGSDPRRPAKEMEAFLYGLLSGLTFPKG